MDITISSTFESLFLRANLAELSLYSTKLIFAPLFKLGVETIRTKTMYNYNMFKYPKVRIYAGPSVYDKIKVNY